MLTPDKNIDTKTIQELCNDHFDIRTITLGINLFDCMSHDFDIFAYRISSKIIKYAVNFIHVCNNVEKLFGISIINKRLSISPIGIVGSGFSVDQMIKTAQVLNDVAKSIEIDFIGGFSALIEKGITPGEQNLIDALPEVMATTEHLCSSINVATTHAGINIDAINLISKKIIAIAHATKNSHGLGCTKLAVFSNISQDIPFMAGAYLGIGEPEVVINIGISGPGVIKKSIEKTIANKDNCTLTDLADAIKQSSYKMTVIGELVGKEVAKKLQVPFGIIDLSLAPTPNAHDSVGEIFQSMGLSSIGIPGSTAILAMLNDAIKKGGVYASSHVGGLSGAFIPVSEDLSITAAVDKKNLSLEKLEAMTSVCSVGLDMIAIPGNTPPSTIAALIADEMAIGVINNKTTAVRVIPVPGKKAYEEVIFGGLLGKTTIMPMPKGDSAAFINLGGHIPAPIHSVKN